MELLRGHLLRAAPGMEQGLANLKLADEREREDIRIP